MNHLTKRLTWITLLILFIPVAIVSTKKLEELLKGAIDESEKL